MPRKDAKSPTSDPKSKNSDLEDAPRKTKPENSQIDNLRKATKEVKTAEMLTRSKSKKLENDQINATGKSNYSSNFPTSNFDTSNNTSTFKIFLISGIVHALTLFLYKSQFLAEKQEWSQFQTQITSNLNKNYQNLESEFTKNLANYDQKLETSKTKINKQIANNLESIEAVKSKIGKFTLFEISQKLSSLNQEFEGYKNNNEERFLDFQKEVSSFNEKVESKIVKMQPDQVEQFFGELKTQQSGLVVMADEMKQKLQDLEKKIQENEDENSKNSPHPETLKQLSDSAANNERHLQEIQKLTEKQEIFEISIQKVQSEFGSLEQKILVNSDDLKQLKVFESDAKKELDQKTDQLQNMAHAAIEKEKNHKFSLESMAAKFDQLSSDIRKVSEQIFPPSASAENDQQGESASSSSSSSNDPTTTSTFAASIESKIKNDIKNVIQNNNDKIELLNGEVVAFKEAFDQLQEAQVEFDRNQQIFEESVNAIRFIVEEKLVVGSTKEKEEEEVPNQVIPETSKTLNEETAQISDDLAKIKEKLEIEEPEFVQKVEEANNDGDSDW